MGRSRLALLLLATAAAAGGGGFAVGARKAFDEGYTYGSLHREILAGGGAAVGLRLAAEDKLDQVPGWLEFELDMALLMVLVHGDALDDPPPYAPAEVHEGVATTAKALRGLAAYRKAHPRTSEFPDLDARVRDAVERYASAP